jgi:hypothetical protein
MRIGLVGSSFAIGTVDIHYSGEAIIINFFSGICMGDDRAALN